MIGSPDITIVQAAAPDKSLAFVLVGAAILVPLILSYTAYAYWFFLRQDRREQGIPLMAPKPGSTQLLWFLGLWLAGVAVLAGVGFAIKLVLT